MLFCIVHALRAPGRGLSGGDASMTSLISNLEPNLTNEQFSGV